MVDLAKQILAEWCEYRLIMIEGRYRVEVPTEGRCTRFFDDPEFLKEYGTDGSTKTLIDYLLKEILNYPKYMSSFDDGDPVDGGPGIIQQKMPVMDIPSDGRKWIKIEL